MEIRNMTNVPFLRLPQEMREMICEYDFGQRVIRIGWENGKLRLANAMYTGPLALPSVCRKFRQETTALLYTEATCQLVTFRFVSLVETWRAAICLNPVDFVDFLRARSEEHTSELQSHVNLVCRLLLEKKKKYIVHKRISECQ